MISRDPASRCSKVSFFGCSSMGLLQLNQMGNNVVDVNIYQWQKHYGEPQYQSVQATSLSAMASIAAKASRNISMSTDSGWVESLTITMSFTLSI